MTKTFYQELKDDKNYQDKLANFESKQITNLEFINKNLENPLRYYQERALFTLNYFLGLSNEDYFKKKLTEKMDDHIIPFYGFEMATGSGKTLLMAANILELLKKGYKDFLILTPNSPIYEKTIQNFSLDHKRCVISDETNLKFNLVTGDTYKDKTCNFEESADFNVYIFNIQKFFERGADKQDDSKGIAYTHRPLEESYWKDDSNNTIPFIEFLRKRKLIIISDEAHHYQAKQSSEVIKELIPQMVLEYTATARENDSDKKEQKVIYKYSIKDLIKDKYAKKIRALGYANLEERPTTQVTDADKRKIILSLLCHIVKKEALKGTRQKPIILIRSRPLEHAQNVLNYIQNDMSEDDNTLSEVLEVTKNEKAPITKLFWDYYSGIKFNKEKLMKELKKIGENSFRMDSDNKNDSEIIEQWDNIEENKYEIVVYKKMLDEGIDLKNIYLLTILSDNDNSEDTKTNVKQAIGRGVRLHKEKREFDDASSIKKQAENLYIICDKGKNFEKFIEKIRQEMDLSTEEFSEDSGEIKVITDEPNRKRLEDLSISTLQIIQKEKEESWDILKILDKAEALIPKFLAEVTQDENGKKFIEFELDNIIDERDIIAQGYQQTLSEHVSEDRKLIFEKRELDNFISMFIEDYPGLPDHAKIRERILEIINKIISRGIYYHTKLGYNPLPVKRYFFNNFEAFFGNFVEKSLFEEKIEIDKRRLDALFNKREIELTEGDVNNYADQSAVSLQNEISFDYLTGFKYSIYEYNRFDSRQELKIARLLEKAMEKSKSKNNFWIKNGRRIEYTIKIKGRGQHEYNPDFIVYFEGRFYVIEVKGTGPYLEEFVKRRNKEKLISLGENAQDITAVLLLSDIINTKINDSSGDFKQIITFNSLTKDKLLAEF